MTRARATRRRAPKFDATLLMLGHGGRKVTQPTPAQVELSDYTPEQLRALLEIGEDMFQIAADLQEQLRLHNARARARLAKVGLL